MPEHPFRAPLRSDAAKNRQALVDAARQAFRDLGADAPYAEVARRAGVAPVTLHRRFPTREDLLVEVFADRLLSCEASATHAATADDPVAGLREHITHLTDLQAEDRAFTAVFLHEFPADSPVSASRTRAGDALGDLLRRAAAAGRIRAGVDGRDVLRLLMANDGVLRWSTDPRTDTASLIDAFFTSLSRQTPATSAD